MRTAGSSRDTPWRTSSVSSPLATRGAGRFNDSRSLPMRNAGVAGSSTKSPARIRNGGACATASQHSPAVIRQKLGWPWLG